MNRARATFLAIGLIGGAAVALGARETSAATTSTTVRPEVTAAVVISNVDPTGLGRVKVKFTIMATGRDNVGWARPVIPLTSGPFTLPEVGDEVLVAFLDGDVSRPVLIGTLVSGP